VPLAEPGKKTQKSLLLPQKAPLFHMSSGGRKKCENGEKDNFDEK
jgi:hypothetical protein